MSRVSRYQPPSVASFATPKTAPNSTSSGGGFFSGLFGNASPPPKPAAAPPRPFQPVGPKGLYVYGACGTGKTFLMDLFYDAVPVKQKRRVHFHEWMIEVHEKLHRLQKKNAMVSQKANTVWTAEAALAQQKQLRQAKTEEKKESADDLVAQVAQEMMAEAWLLCFDEFQVTHISDAIIMKRLFSILFERGAVMVTTSNRPPEDLYLNGLNRPLFLPFIPMLKDCCDVHSIESEKDYRLIATAENEDRRVYISPNGKPEAKLLEAKFYRLSKNQILTGAQVETQGRRIVVPKVARGTRVAWFNFRDLCDKPLGAADYLAIADSFHTVFISDIPRLTLQERDQVRRLITLVDAFYERHTKLVCTADEEPLSLFQVPEADKANSHFDEVFAWDRTASRLIEMQSMKYITDSTRNLDTDDFLGQFDLYSLSDEDTVELWRRYDVNDDGEIDADELRVMLEDILEVQQGHRNLSDDVFRSLFDTMDLDKNGHISTEEFDRYLRTFRLVDSLSGSAE